jgi:hypothetical protein
MLYLLSYGHHAQDDSTSERTPGKASFVPGFVVLPCRSERRRYSARLLRRCWPWIPAPRFRGDRLRGNDG